MRAIWIMKCLSQQCQPMANHLQFLLVINTHLKHAYNYAHCFGRLMAIFGQNLECLVWMVIFGTDVKPLHALCMLADMNLSHPRKWGHRCTGPHTEIRQDQTHIAHLIIFGLNIWGMVWTMGNWHAPQHVDGIKSFASTHSFITPILSHWHRQGLKTNWRNGGEQTPSYENW